MPQSGPLTVQAVRERAAALEDRYQRDCLTDDDYVSVAALWRDVLVAIADGHGRAAELARAAING